MLSSKQRSYLKKMSANLPDTLLIGKDGLTENIIKQAEEQLESRELIKCKILQNSMEDLRQTADTVAAETHAEVVATIGRKFILFRKRPKDSQYTLPV